MADWGAQEIDHLYLRGSLWAPGGWVSYCSQGDRSLASVPQVTPLGWYLSVGMFGVVLPASLLGPVLPPSFHQCCSPEVRAISTSHWRVGLFMASRAPNPTEAGVSWPLWAPAHLRFSLVDHPRRLATPAPRYCFPVQERRAFRCDPVVIPFL